MRGIGHKILSVLPRCVLLFMSSIYKRIATRKPAPIEEERPWKAHPGAINYLPGNYPLGMIGPFNVGMTYKGKPIKGDE